MNISRVVHVFYGDIFGDPLNTRELSLRQSRFGNNISLFTWNKKNCRSYELVNQNFKIYRLKGLNLAIKPFFTEYPFIPHLGLMLEREKSEIIHAHSHLFLTTYAAIMAAKKLDIPSVVTVHGVYAERNMAVNLFQKLYLLSLSTRIFQYSTKIVCLTRAIANELIRFGCPASKIRLITDPVDTDMFKPCPKKEQDNLVVWVGRFVPEKGLEYLIDAAKLVQYRVDDVRFILVGDGPFKCKIESLIKDRGLSNIVSIIGPLEHREVADMLTKASIFAFPSLKEGMGRAMLEAMSTGKPVVVSDIPGMDEIIKNGFNGILVQPRDASALSDKIIDLLNDKKLRKRLGRNARQTMLKSFTWKRHIRLLQAVYEEAVAEV